MFELRTASVFAAAGAISATLAAAQAARTPPVTSDLRIVVIAGEDAVNIVQQKTAVAPVIEVRDRNNLPVSGATVTFALQGGKAAAFASGAQTITVATNAAGQAVATGFSPLAAGTVQINVQAAFQGQVAVATVTQTNVMTAAQAAAVGGGSASGSSAGSSSGGTAGASGGGLSGTTIAIGAAAVAGGALVAVKATQEHDVVLAYGGALSIDMTFTLSTGCLRLERHTGSLQVRLRAPDDNAATKLTDGEVEVVGGVVDVVSTTCPGVPLGRLAGNWSIPNRGVTGSVGNFSYSAQDSVANGAAPGTTDRSFSFSGVPSGGSITGTFQSRWQFPNSSGSGSASVTLTRQ